MYCVFIIHECPCSWYSAVASPCPEEFLNRCLVHMHWYVHSSDVSNLVTCRKSRKTIDTTDTVRTFGPVEIHYGKVQQKVTLKYDSWHKEILSRFGGLLGENMHEFHGTISKVHVHVHALCILRMYMLHVTSPLYRFSHSLDSGSLMLVF